MSMKKTQYFTSIFWAQTPIRTDTLSIFLIGACHRTFNISAMGHATLFERQKESIYEAVKRGLYKWFFDQF